MHAPCLTSPLVSDLLCECLPDEATCAASGGRSPEPLWARDARLSPGHGPASLAPRLPPAREMPSLLEWSGRRTGVFAVRTLTRLQAQVLDRLRRHQPFTVGLPTGEGARSETIHRKTVTSLAQRGFIEARPDGSYAITDHGLHALAVLPRN